MQVSLRERNLYTTVSQQAIYRQGNPAADLDEFIIVGNPGT
jgi:hypothetical protein